jgi:hypothetical protein
MDLDIAVERQRFSIRTCRWPDAARHGEAEDEGRPHPSSAGQVSRASVGIVHYVPPPLRHIGCMWLDEGDETRRCGKPPGWTFGICLDLPRLYCEEHGQLIWGRKQTEHQARRRAS